jgi:CspA family cold shock protein
MNKEHSSWAPRKHGFDDDEPIFHGPRPRFAGTRGGDEITPPLLHDPPARSPTPQGQATAGVVKWFNEQKGYGFVELAGGQGDAFLHANVLQSIGRDSVPPGAKMRVVVASGPKGAQVASVVDIDASSSAARPLHASPAIRPGRGPRRPDLSTAVPISGKVKWFDEGRGFGFVASDDGGKDIFVHISTVSAAGVKQLAEGQALNMRVVETPKGREAIAIAV